MPHELTITPAILVSTFDEFAASVKKIEGIFSYAQIDVMDGEFVANRSFTDIDKINTLDTNLGWELHLMVQHPLTEMRKWTTIQHVRRAIFPVESADNLPECIAYAKSQDWQVGMVLNPETPLRAVEPFLSDLDIVLFMTVTPGKQGNPFVPEVEGKIREFTARSKRPLCAVDGAVSAATIPLLKEWGVEIFNVGSALMKAPDVNKAYKELLDMLTAV